MFAKTMLSIVVPTLNEEKSLEGLLKSLQEQTFRDFEVIIADAGSTDKTTFVAEKFGAHVVKGGLPGAGRNAGAASAKGDLIFFFDADVVLTETFLEETLDKFKEKGLDVATCFFSPISEKKLDIWLHEVVNYFYKATEKVKPHAAGSCILIKKALHEQIGGFDESIKLGEDLEYVQRAGKEGKFGVLINPRFYISVRRLEKDGRFNIALKYLLAESYMTLVGDIRTDLFKYNFAHYKDEAKKEKFREKLKEKFVSLTKSTLGQNVDINKIYKDLILSFKKATSGETSNRTKRN